jgi:WD40 repeat protein
MFHAGFKSMVMVLMAIVLLSTTPIMLAQWGIQVEWSPDGTQLAVVDGQTVTILDKIFQIIETKSFDSPFGFDRLAWSPDGNRLMLGRDIWQVSPLTKLLSIELPYNQLLGWSPDGSQVYAYSQDATGIAIYDAQNGNFVRSVYPQINSPNVLDEILWSPDNQYFAAVTRRESQGQLIIFDTVTGEIITQYPSASSSFSRGTAGGIVWNPNSLEVVFGFRAQVELDTPGSSPSPLPPPFDGAFLPVTVVMDVVTGEESLLLNSAPIDYGYFQWSRAGTELIGGTVNGVFTVWSRTTGEIIDSFALDVDARPVEADLSPYDGRLAVSLGPAILSASADPTLQALSQDNLSRTQYFLNETLAIAVPAPSEERLAAITAACDLPARTEADLDQQAATDLTAFTAQVEALPDTQIAPGCRADLLAVAEALQAQ